jgi:SAM-dependent methyltransferase
MDLSKYHKLLKDRTEWGSLATFTPNKSLPVYNWFYFKEGFARDEVLELLRMFSLKKEDKVLDPFVGSGTTLLGCKERGINSIGTDVLPISIFSSQAKTHEYDISKLLSYKDALFEMNFEKQDIKKFPYRKFFRKFTLHDILFLYKHIKTIPNSKTRDFFLLALISSAIKASYVWKDGGSLKVKERPVPPFRKFFRKVVTRRIKEYAEFSSKVRECETIVKKGDARQLNLEDETISAVITSPPYLNQIDYTKVYRIENWFLGSGDPPLRSYMGLGTDEAAASYTEDMERMINEVHRVLKPGGKAAFVIGNAYFRDQQKIVDCDLILAHLGEKAGLKPKEIQVLNKRFALEDRTKKKGVLRESLVVFEKP